MTILKRPDNIIFDTDTPNKLIFNPIPFNILVPLHDVLLTKSEYEFLKEYFFSIEDVEHPIFKDFGNSYYYCLTI